jgi:2'-5' RNA ligase
MAMVGLKVPHAEARLLGQIGVPGTREAVDEFHVTLFYLGEKVSVEQLSKCVVACFAVTSVTLPFTCQTSQVTTFPPGPDGVPIIARVQSTDLHSLRSALKQSFIEQGVEFSDLHPDFKPHVTLAYSKDPLVHTDGVAEQGIPVVEWGVGEIILWGGDQQDDRLVVTFPFNLAPGRSAAYRALVKLAAMQSVSCSTEVPGEKMGDMTLGYGFFPPESPPSEVADFMRSLSQGPRDSERIARRFQAELLTKEWLDGIRRAWIQLTHPHIQTWEDVFGAFNDLLTFVERLEAQVTFVRRAPKTMETSIHTQCHRIKEALLELRSRARHWKEVASGERDYMGDDPARGEKMFELYRTKFPELLTTRFKAPKAPSGTREGEITELMEKLLADLRSDAKKIDKSLKLDPEGSIQQWGQPAFKDFDLYGMKVIVDDRTVTALQIKQYIRLLDQAYARLRAKGLHQAWYGVVFIQCEDCGGENPWSSGGVGGNYSYGPDVVRIFVRPSGYMPGLVVHELGHRYWFKSMSSEQRARFEDIVRAPDRLKKRPKVPFAGPIQDVYRQCRSILHMMSNIQYELAPAQAKAKFRTVVGQWVGYLQQALTALGKYVAEKELTSLAEAVERLVEIANSYTAFEKAIRKSGHPYPDALAEWAMTVEALVHRIVKETQRLDPKDPSRVTPVSDYGESNIREAFAEAFMHYVMEKDMDRDQLESFRSVLSSTQIDLVWLRRVVARFLGVK